MILFLLITNKASSLYVLLLIYRVLVLDYIITKRGRVVMLPYW